MEPGSSRVAAFSPATAVGQRRLLGRLPVTTVVVGVLAVAIPLAFLAVFFAWPVLALTARGFTDAAGGVDLSNLREVLANSRTWRLVTTTLGQAAAGTAGSLLLGIPAAYLLYRTNFPGRTLVRALITVPFVLPTVVVGVAFRTLLQPTGLLGGLGLSETFAAVVASLVFFNLSVMVRTIGGLWERLDPRVEQAARSLGASPLRAFATVTLPALGPAIASAAAVVFLYCATAFGVIMVLGGPGYGTIETEIYRRTTQFLDLRTAAVLSILQILVVSAALWVANRTRARAERSLNLLGARQAVPWWSARRASDVIAAAVTAVAVAGLIVLPLAGLVIRSFQDGSGQWSLVNFRSLGTVSGPVVVTVWAALGNSLRTAAGAALIAVGVGTLVSLVLSRSPRQRAARRAIAGLDAVVMLPLGVSAVTVGFGFLITMTRPVFGVDLRTAGLLIPIAQAVVAVPLVVRTMLPVLRAINPRLRSAAVLLGASPLRVLRDVDLPIVAPALGLAVGFAFAVSLGEFGATSFLARPDGFTLPVLIFRLIGLPGAGNYGMALAASVLLAALTALVMVAAEALGSARLGREALLATVGPGEATAAGALADDGAVAGVSSGVVSMLRQAQHRPHSEGVRSTTAKPESVVEAGPFATALETPGLSPVEITQRTASSADREADGHQLPLAARPSAGSPLETTQLIASSDPRLDATVDSRPSDPVRLQVRDVVVEYDDDDARALRKTGQRPIAVDGVDLDVHDGEIVALLGPSGCGKSTLLRAIAGLEPLSAGSVTWDGVDQAGVPAHRRGFGLVFQDGQLFPHRNVARNVAYGLEMAHVPRAQREARVQELLDVVGLGGYGTRNVATLSGGERQRVALARALAPQPRLLLLDEPFSALDRSLRERLAQDVRVILKSTDTPAIIVTHDPAEAEAVADRIYRMDRGRIV